MLQSIEKYNKIWAVFFVILLYNRKIYDYKKERKDKV